VKARRPELDGVRAIAALSVLVFHAVGFWARGSAPGAEIRPWVGRADAGVTIFFLLSGFLLYRPFVARGPGRLGEYAVRRFLRIVPAYWVALTVAAIVLPLHYVFTAGGVPTFYGFAQVYRGTDVAGQGLGQAWTLCVEVAFYVFLPLWVLLIGRHRGALWPLALLYAASVAYQVVVLGLAGDRVAPLDNALIALPGFLDHFALGMGLAVLSLRWEQRGRIPAAARAGGAWWLAAALLFVAVALALWHARLDSYTHTQWLVRHELYGLIALAVMVPAVARSGWPARLLATAPLRHLGEISYGIYLYHLLVLALLSRWGLVHLEEVVHPYLLWTICGFAGSVVLAELSWRLVERPLMGLGRRRRAPAAQPAPARQA
jgi:peptidoglycan/LPS O-acetylase OafA/YrhL